MSETTQGNLGLFGQAAGLGTTSVSPQYQPFMQMMGIAPQLLQSQSQSQSQSPTGQQLTMPSANVSLPSRHFPWLSQNEEAQKVGDVSNMMTGLAGVPMEAKFPLSQATINKFVDLYKRGMAPYANTMAPYIDTNEISDLDLTRVLQHPQARNAYNEVMADLGESVNNPNGKPPSPRAVEFSMDYAKKLAAATWMEHNVIKPMWYQEHAGIIQQNEAQGQERLKAYMNATRTMISRHNLSPGNLGAVRPPQMSGDE